MKKQTYALALLALVCTGAAAKTKRSRGMYDPFARMDAMMEQMRADMSQMAKSFEALWEDHRGQTHESLNLSIDEGKDQNHVVITVENVQTNNVNANVNEDEDVLTLKTDDAQLTIHVQDKYISIDLSQHVEKRTENDDKKSKGNAVHIATSRSSFGRTVPHAIALIDPNPGIDYDAQSKTLTIKLAYLKKGKTKGTAIPVNIMGIDSAKE